MQPILEHRGVLRYDSGSFSKVRATHVKQFYPMRASEAATLVFLVAFSVVSFLPIWRRTELAGMAMFGWLMAALMVLSPALALLVFLRRPK